VLAIYVDRSGPPPGNSGPSSGKEQPSAPAGLKDLHYAMVLNPELIRRWTENRDQKLWVSPPAEPKPAGKQ
jgi:hypothetical protein